MTKKISVIVNCHNGEKYLYKCISSILDQKYKNLEIIFYDNFSSDNSKNIISAVNQANDQGIEVFVFTGNDGGDLASISKNIIYIPSNKTARIQEMHITIGQILCSALEQNLGLV